ncbi:MAG: ABC transporter substrate-binding protein [Sutterellaceae bacterium]|nr:ABC transporter substrate-binding protein [Sutterellaceae bacterium]
MTQPFLQRMRATAVALSCALVSVTLQARIVTDDLNRQVDIPDTVTRAVVADIYPLASSLALFLKGPENIVGIHPVSMAAVKGRLLGELWPKMTEIETGFMKGSEVNVETLLALEPEVVFVNANNKALVAKLDDLGIKALAVSTNKYDYNVLKTFEGWMTLLQSVWPEVKVADAAKSETDAIVKLVKERTAGMERKARVFFLVNYDNRRIVTSGSHFFGQFWADASGAVNVAESITAQSSNAVVNMEQVYAFNPDVVFITNFTKAEPETLYTNAWHDWTPVKAVADKRVYKMPLGVYRSYTPAADSPLTLLWMAKTLYPEQFADIDLKARAKTFYKNVFGLNLTDAQVESLYGKTP